MHSNPSPAAARRVRIWDLPTRLFHWGLVLALIGSVTSVQLGAMQWHFRFGYAVLALLAFRLAWGFVGGHWSRFVTFAPTPGRLARYVGGKPAPGDGFDVGHNPLGAISVFAMLLVLVAQVATGLVADDEQGTNGPLVALVSGAWSRLGTRWHKGWGEALIYALVALHVAAVFYYLLIKKRNLLRPMVSGDVHLQPAGEHADAGPKASRDGTASRIAAAVVLAACAALAVWISTLG